MNANQINKESVLKMDLATANSALTVSGITAMQRQLVQTRIKKLTAPEKATPVQEVQEQIASDSTTGAPAEDAQEGSQDAPPAASQEASPAGDKPAEVPEVKVVVEVKNKPGETTFTIPAFTNDTKGIRAGTKENPLARVTYTEKGTQKVCTGTVQRLFQFYDEAKYKHKGGPRQEAKILGDNGARLYRFEEEINLVVITPITPEPEVTKVEDQAEGTGI